MQAVPPFLLYAEITCLKLEIITFDRIKNHFDNYIISGKKPKYPTISEAQYQ